MKIGFVVGGLIASLVVGVLIGYRLPRPAPRYSIVGVWSHEGAPPGQMMAFRADGSFLEVYLLPGRKTRETGRWHLDGNELLVTDRHFTDDRGADERRGDLPVMRVNWLSRDRIELSYKVEGGAAYPVTYYRGG